MDALDILMRLKYVMLSYNINGVEDGAVTGEEVEARIVKHQPHINVGIR